MACLGLRVASQGEGGDVDFAVDEKIGAYSAMDAGTS